MLGRERSWRAQFVFEVDNTNKEHEGEQSDAVPRPATGHGVSSDDRVDAVANVLSADSAAVVNLLS